MDMTRLGPLGPAVWETRISTQSNSSCDGWPGAEYEEGGKGLEIHWNTFANQTNPHDLRNVRMGH